MKFRCAPVLSLSACLALVASHVPTASASLSPLIITQNGAVVENLSTDRQIIVQANDVTLRNVTANRLWHQRPYEGLTVVDSTFAGNDATTNIGAVVQPDTLLDGVTIVGHKDGLYIETGGSVTVRDTLIDIRSSAPDDHSDGVTLPFQQNFNGEADFVFESSAVWAEGKTAAFNQQGLPVTVVDSAWSGSLYAAEGSSYQGFAQNPDDLRLYGRVVPWEIPRADFDAVVDFDVRPLTDVGAFEVLEGDFSGDGQVAQGDLDKVLTSWGGFAPASASAAADRPNGIVDQDELNRLLTNWGASSSGSVPSFAFTSLPEPAAAAMLLGLLPLLRRRAA